MGHFAKEQQNIQAGYAYSRQMWAGEMGVLNGVVSAT